MSSAFSRFAAHARVAVVCIFIASIALFAYITTAMAAQICNTSGSIPMGKYWLNSNLWGASSGSGTQCISDVSNNGSSIAWNTNWSWTGTPNSVKSYDSSVLGWHWGWMNSNTGLPIQLSSNTAVQTSWTFNLNQTTPGGQDVSYDTWLSPNANLGNASPSDEVMVWLYHTGGVGPVGTKQATVTIDGTSWDLYEGNIGWEVYSFVRTTNTTSESLNLMDFYQYLISRGLSSSKYLLSVESGTEVFTGAGSLDTTSYYTNVGGSSPTPTPTPTRVPTSTPTPTPTRVPTSTPVPTTTPSPTSGVHVSYQVQNQWAGGFTASIAITNSGSTPINGWQLKFAFPGTQQISQLWNGQVSQSGNQVTISNASYNGTIAPGQSVSLGFNGTWSGSNPSPTSFTVNGTPAS
jgi:Glycosyl hydrolase family 12/Cellulose binding domain